MLILDSSNSMWGQFENDTKGVVAGRALAESLKNQAGRFDLGLMSYGHRSKVSCQDIETVLPVGPIDPAAISSRIEGLRPQGRTPISRALAAAMQELKAGDEPSAIVLIADGLDNCGPDPCAAAAALKTTSAGLAVHVVALGVPPQDHPKLSCISTNTGGSFASASSHVELTAALNTAFNLVAAPQRAGTPVAATAPRTVTPAELDAPMSTAAAEAAQILGLSPSKPFGPSKKWARFKPPVPRINPRAPEPEPEPDPVPAPIASAPAPPPAATTTAMSQDTQPAPLSQAPAQALEEPVRMAEVPVETQAEVPAVTPPAPAEATPGTIALSAAMDPERATTEITGAIPEPDTPEVKAIVPRAIEMGDRKLPTLPNAVRPAYLVAEQVVDAGEETVKLSARITAATKPITRPVQWTVHKVEETTQDKWPLIGERSIAETKFELDPGQYLVRATYGAIKAAKVLLVQPRQQVDVTFILNGGGLRVRPALAFLDPPRGIVAKHWVFETEADKNGNRRLFAESRRTGEVVRLNAGTYHLVSRFGDANAVVETDVTVKPGMLTEVEINHKVGIVHLGFARHDSDSPTGTVSWQINDAKGTVIVRAEGSRISQVLAPGTYTAIVEYAGLKHEATFDLDIGETRDVNVAGR